MKAGLMSMHLGDGLGIAAMGRQIPRFREGRLLAKASTCLLYTSPSPRD